MKEPNVPKRGGAPGLRTRPHAIIKAEGGLDKPKALKTGRKNRLTDLVEDLTAVLSQKVVGQPTATRVIVPYIQMFQAGLAPEGRPVGVFLLLGPTGTGKTKTVEALAEVLHGVGKECA